VGGRAARREQPPGGALLAEGGVAAAGGDQLQDEAGQRLGEHHRLAAQPQADRTVVAGVDVVEGEAADRRWPLSVEEHQQPGDAVLGLEGVVVQQPAGLLPAGLGVDDARGAAPPGGGEVQAGQLLSVCPADEVPDLEAPVGAGGGGGVVAGSEPPLSSRNGGYSSVISAA
jgi:hypothetical protein